MIEVASLIVVNLIIAAIIGFFIGYFVGKSGNKSYTPSSNGKEDTSTKSKKDESKSKSSVNPIFRKNSSVDNKPLVLSTPRPAGRDNLKKIKGIDSKVEKDLNSLGIFHFNQITAWSSKNCDWIEEFLHLPNCAKKHQWIEQAKILAAGNETVYSQKVESKEITFD